MPVFQGVGAGRIVEPSVVALGNKGVVGLSGGKVSLAGGYAQGLLGVTAHGSGLVGHLVGQASGQVIFLSATGSAAGMVLAVLGAGTGFTCDEEIPGVRRFPFRASAAFDAFIPTNHHPGAHRAVGLARGRRR